MSPSLSSDDDHRHEQRHGGSSGYGQPRRRRKRLSDSPGPARRRGAGRGGRGAEALSPMPMGENRHGRSGRQAKARDVAAATSARAAELSRRGGSDNNERGAEPFPSHWSAPETILSGLADVFVFVARAVIAKVIQGQIEMQNRIDRMQSRF